jgi:hypothetical protein
VGERLGRVLGAALGKLAQPVGVEPRVRVRQVHAAQKEEAVEHLAQAAGAGDLGSLAQPAQAGAPRELRAHLEQRLQPATVLVGQWLRDPALDALVRPPADAPDHPLDRREAGRNDLLRAQPLEYTLDQRQGVVALQRQREQGFE